MCTTEQNLAIHFDIRTSPQEIKRSFRLRLARRLTAPNQRGTFSWPRYGTCNKARVPLMVL